MLSESCGFGVDLGCAVTALFREKMAVKAIEELLTDRVPGSVKLDTTSQMFRRL